MTIKEKMAEFKLLRSVKRKKSAKQKMINFVMVKLSIRRKEGKKGKKKEKKNELKRE